MERGCPRLYPLRLLARKWGFLVLHALRHPRTFSQLKRELHSATSKTVSSELEILQQEGLVLHVGQMYLLAKRGRSLLEACQPLHDWAVEQGMRSCSTEQRCSHCCSYPAEVVPRLLKLNADRESK